MTMFSLEDALYFNWSELYNVKSENDFGIEAYLRLNKTLELSVVETMRKFQEEVENDVDLKVMQADGSGGSYYQAFYEWEEKAIEELQRQQRYALCLSIFSFFEGRLKTICSKIEGINPRKILIDDLKGEDLLKYKTYLERVYEVDLSTLESYFTPINQQKKTRNIIAHQDGVVRKDQKSKIVLVTGLELVEMNTDEFLIKITESQYIETLIRKMDKFLDELIKLVDIRFKELTD